MNPIQLIIAISFLILACSRSDELNIKELSVTTDLTEYAIGDTILLSIQSLSDSAVLFMVCNGEIMINLDKYNSTWETISDEYECVGFGTYCCDVLMTQEVWQFVYPTSYMTSGKYRFSIVGIRVGGQTEFVEEPISSNNFKIE